MEKLKLVIADDEAHVRKGLSKFITTECSGIEVVGVFQNGKALINYLSENPVDIIIADICMPNSSGLDIAEYIRNHHLNTHVVIITAYKDFEYAKKAVDFGVDAFITKPLDFTELLTALRKIEKEIIDRQIADERVRFLQETLNNRHSVSKHIFLFTEGKLSLLELRNTFNLYGVTWLDKPCGIIHFTSSNKNDLISSKSNWEYFCDVDNDILDAYTVYSDEKKIVVVIGYKHNNPISITETFLNYCEDIKKLIKLEAKIELQYSIEEYKSLSDILYKRYDSQAKTCMQYLLKNNHAESEFFLEAFSPYFDSCTDETAKILTEMIINRLAVISDVNLSEFLEQVKVAVTSDDCKKILKQLNEYNLMDEKSIIRQVCSYVKANCDKEYNLSLSAVADAFDLNSAYLSREFKKKTGEAFNKYVMRTKIDASKDLLVNTDYPIQTIARIFYFCNTAYYSKVFKEFEGVTPNNYRSMNKRKH